MHHTNTKKPRVAATAALALLLAGLLLAACGSSSSSPSTSTSTNAAATGAAPAAGGSGAFQARFKALRECLTKNGITLPERKPGQHRTGGAGGFFGGGTGPALPAGVTRAQYEAALKKCGGGLHGGLAGGGSRVQTPEAKAALNTFAACMRSNGVDVGTPNTSGSGPIFSSTGVDQNSPQFKAASAKCLPDLRGVLGPRPGKPGGLPGARGGVPVAPNAG